MHGRGCFEDPRRQGARYDGEWLDGRRHGRGVLTLPGEYTYDGEWFEQRKSGSGILRFEDGSTHTGAFENDLYAPAG
jgi:hypothetical protein